MVEKVPSLIGGGVFWFTDLTTPDPLYICPVLAALTFLATVEVCSLSLLLACMLSVVGFRGDHFPLQSGPEFPSISVPTILPP